MVVGLSGGGATDGTLVVGATIVLAVEGAVVVEALVLVVDGLGPEVAKASFIDIEVAVSNSKSSGAKERKNR